jgi:hypothetical protein
MEVTDTQLADRYASLPTTELVDLFKLDTLTQQARSILENELASRGVGPSSVELTAHLAFTDSKRSSSERAEAFDQWIQTFYRCGSADELARALEYFVDSEAFASAADISLFTFARAAVLYPEIVADYEVLLDDEALTNRNYVGAVIALAKGETPSSLPVDAHPRFLRSGSALELPIHTGCDLDCLWAEFFLTGNRQAVERVAEVAHGEDWLRARLGRWLRLPVTGILGRIKHALQLSAITRITGVQFDRSNNVISSNGDLDRLAHRYAHWNVTNAVSGSISAIISVLPFDCSQAEIEQFALKAAADWSLTSLGETHAVVREVYSE